MSGKVTQPTVRINDQLIGEEGVQRSLDALGDEFRRLDLLGLDVQHTEPERMVPPEPLDHLQVLIALAGELQDELVHVRVGYRRKQEVVPISAAASCVR
jgi:hypothetical protein